MRGSKAEPLREPGLSVGLFCHSKRLNPGKRHMRSDAHEGFLLAYVCTDEVLTKFATEWLFHLQAEMGSDISKSTKTGSFSLLTGSAAGHRSPCT